jgi:hypothetical protein
MHIEVHRFKATLKILTESGLGLILEALGIPRQFWKEKRDLRTGELFALEYSLGSDTQSLYLRMGRLQVHSCMNPETGEVLDCYPYAIPPGFEKYYMGGSLLIHGNFFDDATGFNFGRLLEILQATGYNPQELDVAYVDDLGVTTLDDWLNAFESWRNCVKGNIVKRQIISIVRDSGEFIRVQIGAATSRTAYGTFYRRPDGSLRLEIKYRKPEHIRQLLKPYDEEERAAFEKMALDVLVSSLDIVTPETFGDRKPTRAAFYSAFLDSQPKRVKRQSKASQTTKSSVGKYYAARIQNAARRLCIPTPDMVAQILGELGMLPPATA